jgi:hypothetical protein
MKKLACLFSLLFFVLSANAKVSISFSNDYLDVYHLSLIIYTPDGKIQTRVSNLNPAEIKTYILPGNTEIFIADNKQEAFAMKGNDIKATGVKPSIVLKETDSEIVVNLSSLTQGAKSKEEVLKSIVGKYELDGISSFMGANTMVDYYKPKGIWKGSMSMLVMGRRQAEAIKISPNVLKKLNTMKIMVNPDLSVVFSCNEIPIATIPFKADGMLLELQGTSNENWRDELKQLKSTLTFQDEFLFLYAKEYVDETQLEPYDIVDVLPNAIIISYNVKENGFQVVLCESEGTGFSTYEFKKGIIPKK